MDEVLAIAETVWRRILKMWVVYFLIICAVAEISITVLYDTLTMGEERALMIDLSLLLTTLAGVMTVLALAFDIPREMRDGGAATLLSKPVGRYQYLFGKYVGILVVALFITSLISVGFCVVHYYFFGTLQASAVQGHLLVVLQVFPMVAIGLFFSALLSEAAAAVLTIATVWLAHSTPVLFQYPLLYGGLLPDLNLFNLRAEATHNVSIDWLYIGLVLLWGLLYTTTLVSLTALIFNQRDLK